MGFCFPTCKVEAYYLAQGTHLPGAPQGPRPARGEAPRRGQGGERAGWDGGSSRRSPVSPPPRAVGLGLEPSSPAAAPTPLAAGHRPEPSSPLPLPPPAALSAVRPARLPAQLLIHWEEPARELCTQSFLINPPAAQPLPLLGGPRPPSPHPGGARAAHRKDGAGDATPLQTSCHPPYTRAPKEMGGKGQEPRERRVPQEALYLGFPDF